MGKQEIGKIFGHCEIARFPRRVATAMLRRVAVFGSSGRPGGTTMDDARAEASVHAGSRQRREGSSAWMSCSSGL